MRLFLLISLLLWCAALHAETVREGKICSDDKSLCINGILRVDSSKGLVTLVGRVRKTTRPGFIRITLHGYGETQIFVAYLQGRIDGKYSEVIDLKNGASHNSDTKWMVKRFEYLLVE